MIPYKHVAHDVGDVLDGHLAHPSRCDQLAINLPPALDVDLPVLEVRRPLAVLEVGSLLNQQLDVLRMLCEERQKRRDRPGDPLETVVDPRRCWPRPALAASASPGRPRPEKVRACWENGGRSFPFPPEAWPPAPALPHPKNPARRTMPSPCPGSPRETRAWPHPYTAAFSSPTIRS